MGLDDFNPRTYTRYASASANRNATDRNAATGTDGDWQDRNQSRARGAYSSRRAPGRVMLAAARFTASGVETRVITRRSVIYMDLDLALSDLQRDARHAGRAWGCLVVQIDDFGGITGCIRALLRFRHLCPTVPVILLSTQTMQEDLSLERLTLCDVTLRTPVSAAAWRPVLGIARKNNRVWQSRMMQRAGDGRRA
ncbi:hypothetical protein [Rhodovulum strictum]|uniref:Uncharacterized protein n=1 Tax=Rhodovulum strictum TaxID=58314 RepID=A0A844BAG7_9RHOB|nr:hypothetical protein [Rhodovulum strictum]MRH22580.1 hypothetical protein [Rhodovulum strictum]